MSKASSRLFETSSLLFFGPSLGAIGVALLSLITGFSIEDRFVVADIED
jgi:hypothetical protein